MRCLNCGLEYNDEYSNCPNCGTAAPIAEPISLNPIADRVLFALKDKLFFALCILVFYIHLSLFFGRWLAGNSDFINNILMDYIRKSP